MNAALTCPQCGQHMTLDLQTDRVHCTHCGYVRPDEISALDSKEAAIEARGHEPSVSMLYAGDINPGAQAAFDSGQDALFAGNKEEALKAFRRAADFQNDFTDAHLWIARTSDDQQVKRDEIGIVLGLAPNNLEAMRMLLVLDGKMTPAQAAQTYHYNDQQVRQADSPVSAKVTELICPRCGGELTVNAALQRVECRFCGYTAPHPDFQSGAEQNLTVALLRRKAQPVRWNVGERVVMCQQCGAEQTVTADHLSERCRFCGSTAVIESDALGSFTQPEGLVPFTVSQADAHAAIDNALKGLGERLTNLLNGANNQIERGTVQNVYLPFWTFDIIGEATRVKRIGGDEVDRDTNTAAQQDLPVCAVKSPPTELTDHLAPFDFSAEIAYEPRWLANCPAQLYRIDFDAASLDARADFTHTLKAQYEQNLGDTLDARADRNHPVSIDLFTNITSMTFRLVLLPVWIATLVEHDGDVRLALVNGQSGAVALGKAHKPSAA
jgi:ribosomal protein S27AE